MLELYLVLSVIFLMTGFGSFIGHGMYNKVNSEIAFGFIGIFLFGILFVIGTNEYHEPKAIEVYQGKTILEYTVKDGVKTDSVVVYRNVNK